MTNAQLGLGSKARLSKADRAAAAAVVEYAKEVHFRTGSFPRIYPYSGSIGFDAADGTFRSVARVTEHEVAERIIRGAERIVLGR